MRTTYIAKEADVVKKWYVIDATDVTLGRLASEVANILRGKNKPQYAPNVDMGDYVIIVNAEKISVTGKKLDNKIYYHHSGYPGGMKTTTPSELRKRRPIAIIEKAVKGMIPHTKLGAKQFKNLYEYAGSEHKHEEQKPKKLEVK